MRTNGLLAQNSCETVLGNSTFQGYSWRAARAMALKAYEETPLNARIEANRVALAANQVATGDIAGLQQWLADARTRLSGPFGLESMPAGADRIFSCITPAPTTTAAAIDLVGTGPFDLATVRVTRSGVTTTHPVTRLSTLDWKLVSYPLLLGQNILSVAGLDSGGVVIGQPQTLTIQRN